MIERPPGDDSSDSSSNDDSSSDDAPTASGSSSAMDPYAQYTEEKERFIAKLGRDIDIDP